MATTYTWSITSMQCYPTLDTYQNVIFNVSWLCTGINDNYQGSVYSNCAVVLNPLSPYTPYEQLTQDQILNWVWSSGIDKIAMEATVEQQIQNQITPPVISPPLPWPTTPAE